MLEGMARQGGVVGLDVHLEIRRQVVLPQEVHAGSHIEVVLVLGGLLRLGLQIEIAGKADLAAVVTGHTQEAGHVVKLQPHVGVQQGVVALAAAPEYIAGGAQLHRGIQAGPDFSGGGGKHIGAAGGGGTGHELLVAEVVGRYPQALLAGLLLQLVQIIHHHAEVGDALGQGSTLRGDVHVMEAVVVDVQLFHQLEGEVRLGAELGHGVRLAHGLIHGTGAEHIHALGVDGMPIAQRELQMLTHFLAGDDLVRVIPTEGKGVGPLGIVDDLTHISVLFHVITPPKYVSFLRGNGSWAPPAG